VKLRERWIHGASVCAYLAILALVSVGVVALCAFAFIIPYELLFGDLAEKSVRTVIAVTAVLVLPIYVSIASDSLPRAESESAPNGG